MKSILQTHRREVSKTYILKHSSNRGLKVFFWTAVFGLITFWNLLRGTKRTLTNGLLKPEKNTKA